MALSAEPMMTDASTSTGWRTNSSPSSRTPAIQMNNRVRPSRTHIIDTPSSTNTNSYFVISVPVRRPYHSCFRRYSTLSSPFQSTVVNIPLMPLVVEFCSQFDQQTPTWLEVNQHSKLNDRKRCIPTICHLELHPCPVQLCNQ